MSISLAIFLCPIVAFVALRCWRNLTVGICIVLLSIALSPTITTELPPPFGEIRAADLLILLLSGIILLGKSNQTLKLSKEATQFGIILLMLAAVSVWSNIYAWLAMDIPLLSNVMLAAIQPLQWVLYLVVAVGIAKRESVASERITSTMAIAAGIACVVGVCQYYNIGPVRDVIDSYYPQFLRDQSQFNESNMRVTATFDGNSNNLACFLVISVGLILSECVFKRVKVALIAILLGAMFTLVLTGSRTYLFSGCILLALASFRKPAISLIIIVGVAAYLQWMPDTHRSRWGQFVLSDDEVYMSGGVDLRWRKLNDLGELVLSNSPLFGFGGSGYFGSTSDVNYLRILIDAGLIGLILLIALFLFLFWQSTLRLRRSALPLGRVLGGWLLTAFVVFFVGSWGSRPQEMPRVGEVLWIIIGLSLSTGERCRPGSERKDGHMAASSAEA